MLGDVHFLFESYEGYAVDLGGQNVHNHALPVHNEDPSEAADRVVSDSIVLPYAAPSRKLLHGCHSDKCDATARQ